MIRWIRGLRRKEAITHAFRGDRTTSICGIATLEGPWKVSPRTPRCSLCEKKAAVAGDVRRVRQEDTTQKFKGLTGRTPQAEAKRHVYTIAAEMLGRELTSPDGPMFDGIQHADDMRRIRYAIEQIRAELLRKSQS